VWPVHKLYCTEDPALKRHVATEMAFERILAQKRRSEVPDGAQCFICLDGGDVLRDCACRGPSAGFAHVDCLAEMAARDPSMCVEGRGELNRWSCCGLCHQDFTLALGVEMTRRRWRHFRDTPESEFKCRLLRKVSAYMMLHHEGDVADRLEQEASQRVSSDEPGNLMTAMARAYCLVEEARPEAALELLNELRPSVARCCHLLYLQSLYVEIRARTLESLGRHQEALPFIAKAAELDTRTEGPESQQTLDTRRSHARLLIKAGRVDEGTDALTQVLAAQTRVLGADHLDTRKTKALLDSLSARSS